MPDHYRNFDHLFSAECRGVDYRVSSMARQSPVLIMAPHGGAIEPGTSQIARRIAGDDHSLLLFEGIKSDGNWRLHIRSETYELPEALKMAWGADRLITIHGCREEDRFTLVGGLDNQLRRHIAEELKASGLPVSTSPRSGLAGEAPENICNRNSRKAGVQIELSRGQRRQMFGDFGRRGRGEPTEAFYRFCESVRTAIVRALSAGEQAERSILDRDPAIRKPASAPDALFRRLCSRSATVLKLTLRVQTIETV